jgi:anti-anti-sigma regulatory factor
MQSINNAAESKIFLPAILDMAAARQLKDMLARSLIGGGGVAIDASSVTRLSTASMQILIAFSSAMAASKRPIAVVRPSPAFVSGFACLGLSPALLEA